MSKKKKVKIEQFETLHTNSVINLKRGERLHELLDEYGLDGWRIRALHGYPKVTSSDGLPVEIEYDIVLERPFVPEEQDDEEGSDDIE